MAVLHNAHAFLEFAALLDTFSPNVARWNNLAFVWYIFSKIKPMYAEKSFTLSCYIERALLLNNKND